MTAALLFASSFVVVLALGLQQLNVERRRIIAAALTSPVIGLATFVQFKLLPGPTTGVEVLGFLLGGSAGIVAAIVLHPHLLRVAGRWVPRTIEWAPPETPPLPPIDLRAAQADSDQRNRRAEYVGETLRLATEIADDMARLELQRSCFTTKLAGVTWYDTHAPLSDHPGMQAKVDRMLAYLLHRERVIVHPVQLHLVRFAR